MTSLCNLILVGIDSVASSHRHADWAQRVENANGSSMRPQNFRQTPICLRRLIDISAAQFYSAVCHPLHHLIMTHQTVAANSLAPHPIEFTFGCRARHDSTSPVNRRVKRLT